MDEIRNKLAKMQYGKLYALVFSVFGWFILLMEIYFIVDSQLYHPKFFIASIIFVGMGLVLALFSGGKFSKSDYPDFEFNASSGIALLWKLAPKSHQVIWVISLIFWIVLAFWAETQIENNFE